MDDRIRFRVARPERSEGRGKSGTPRPLLRLGACHPILLLPAIIPCIENVANVILAIRVSLADMEPYDPPVIAPSSPDGVEETLQLTLAEQSEDEQAETVQVLLDEVRRGRASLAGLLDARRRGRLVGGIFSQVEPGRTARRLAAAAGAGRTTGHGRGASGRHLPTACRRRRRGRSRPDADRDGGRRRGASRRRV